MVDSVTFHFDNTAGYAQPVLYLKAADSDEVTQLEPADSDEYGPFFRHDVSDNASLCIKFGDLAEPDNGETDTFWRCLHPIDNVLPNEVWARSWNVFLYASRPCSTQPESAAQIVEQHTFASGVYVSESGGKFGVGATPLADGGVLFGLFHPHAAHVYVVGDFNDWQYPDAENANSEKFLPMQLYKGYFDAGNVWLLKVDEAKAEDKYKFYVEYEAYAAGGIIPPRLSVDPYARQLGPNFDRNNGVIIDAASYQWGDEAFETPAIHDLIIYELNVHGFTWDDMDVTEANRGRFAGIEERITSGYFDKMGINVIYLMPISEVPTPQGETALGYNTALYMAVERDFGTPEDLRRLVDTAHQHGIAVIIDQVFNHSANAFNPLWKFILDHPDEMGQGEEGGLYFSGSSPWGNRLATERAETQNMLIDACKMMLTEYHLDGFRFDATHSMYIDHSFLQRLANELQAFKPGVILIAENLPNEPDLNREGYNGFAQWCDFFHDTIKSFLREGKFEGTDNKPEALGDVFYFSKGRFAAHTNNVINYCESHDEHSVAHEVSFVNNLNTPQAKERKSRLGLFATMVALGQPMIYMGQEFAVERPRNVVYFDFPKNLDDSGFFQWASRLIRLRRRYPGLKLNGYNPIAEGEFTWLLGPWMDARHGGGKRVLGWRAKPNGNATDELVILLNMENHPIEVDIPFGTPGYWVRLATMDYVNDIEPDGNNSIEAEGTLQLEDGNFGGFTLPDSFGFIYKWQQSL